MGKPLEILLADKVELPFLNKNGPVRPEANSSAMLHFPNSNSMTAELMQAVNNANLQSQSPLRNTGFEFITGNDGKMILNS